MYVLKKWEFSKPNNTVALRNVFLQTLKNNEMGVATLLLFPKYSLLVWAKKMF